MPRLLHVAGEVGPGLGGQRGGLDSGDFEGAESQLRGHSVIADPLGRRGVEYAYEQAPTIDGETKYPDFTIESTELGVPYFWEHGG